MSNIYRVTWTQGNGYRCTCCRDEWETHEDYDNLEDAEIQIELLKNARGKRHGPYSDLDDNRDIKLSIIESETKYN